MNQLRPQTLQTPLKRKKKDPLSLLRLNLQFLRWRKTMARSLLLQAQEAEEEETDEESGSMLEAVAEDSREPVETNRRLQDNPLHQETDSDPSPPDRTQEDPTWSTMTHEHDPELSHPEQPPQKSRLLPAPRKQDSRPDPLYLPSP